MHFILELDYAPSPSLEHMTPMLASLHELPVHYRVPFKILLLVFKCLNALSPPSLSELLGLYSPTNQLLLEVPKSKRKLREDQSLLPCCS